MSIEDREQAAVITHVLAQTTLTTLRAEDTSRVEFRNGLARLGRICGCELLDNAFERESVTVQTPLAEATGECVVGRDDVVLINILRAATPFVDGLFEIFPDARLGMISASRDEEAGMDDRGQFPIAIDYETSPTITPDDTVIVADPMLATGSTMCAVLDRLVDQQPTPARLFILSAVSAPAGLARVNEEYPDTNLVTVAIDDHLDENGFIVPGLGDAGDRAFGTA